MVVDAEDRLKELLEENEMDGPVFKIADASENYKSRKIYKKNKY